MREERTTGPVAPEIVLQADVGGITIAFTELVSGADAAKLDHHIDIFAGRIERLRSMVAIKEVLTNLAAVKKALVSWRSRRDTALKGIAEQKAHAAAQMAAQFGTVGGPRSDRVTAKQRDALSQYDTQIQAEIDKFAKEKQGMELQIPIYAAQADRLRKVIAGEMDYISFMEAEVAAAEEAGRREVEAELAEAAE